MPTAPPSPARDVWLNRLLAATALLSAFLLFQVQPIVAKRILPWFGGGTAVWTTVTLFFQTALLAGYLYSHLSVKLLAPPRQARLHAALLAVVATLLIFNRVVPGDAWKPLGSDRPVTHILLMLTACVGPPFVVLAATAPLVQVWFARTNPGRSPYRLYALSNVGSLAALLTYPFAVEPAMGVARQGVVWSILFAGFALMCSASAILALRAASAQPAPKTTPAAATTPNASPESPPEPPRWLQWFFWLALPACASVLLLAITGFLCQDVASIPLLWILPLAVYLITFILTFDSDRWYRRRWWLPALAIFSCLACYSWHVGAHFPLYRQVIAHLALMFSAGMVCHGELARLRPAPRRLTSYYLAISAGGALGGLLAAVVAPLTLRGTFELQIGVAAAWWLALAAVATDRQPALSPRNSRLRLAAMAILGVGMPIAFYYEATQNEDSAVFVDRNFYGVLTVREKRPEEPTFAHYELENGRISHGAQFRAQQHRRLPTTYYQPLSGVGLFLALPRPKFERVGVVGLGAGTLAAYAEKDEEFVFYDINPLVIDFAEEYFTYLKDARSRGAKITVIPGDARLALERQPPQNFDVLVLDAFNGDAIPTHLLTQEAFELYLRHVKRPRGLLAIHTSNVHLFLPVVLMAVADRYGLDARVIDHPGDEMLTSRRSIWVLLSTEPGFFAPYQGGETLRKYCWGRRPVTWTDDYSNILGILK